MIEESEDFYQIEEKFLVVLDSAIPSQISASNASLEQSFINKSNLVFDLQTPIQKSFEDIQLKCSVKSAIIPNSQYLINSTNSLFAIALLDESGIQVNNGVLPIRVPIGNYSTESLRSTLESLINTELYNDGFSNTSFSVSYDTITYTYLFSMQTTSTTIDQFYISFRPKDIITNTSVSQLGTVLGFLNDIVYVSGFESIGQDTNVYFSDIDKVVPAPFPSNLSGLRSINVILQNYNTNSITVKPFRSILGYADSIINSNFNNSSLVQFFRNNVMCNIVCNANPMEYIYYEKQSDFFIELKEPTLGRINIMLADTYGNLLELNNQDWTITLEFTLLKKKQFKTKSFYEYLARS
jgi:hypothetical protein